MLISRFILDLRENYVSRNDEDEYTLHISDLTTIGFEPPGSPYELQFVFPSDGSDSRTEVEVHESNIDV